LEFNVPFQHKHGYIRDEAGTLHRLLNVISVISFCQQYIDGAISFQLQGNVIGLAFGYAVVGGNLYCYCVIIRGPPLSMAHWSETRPTQPSLTVANTGHNFAYGPDERHYMGSCISVYARPFRSQVCAWRQFYAPY